MQPAQSGRCPGRARVGAAEGAEGELRRLLTLVTILIQA
jgi:hypothetical protein